MEYKTDINLDKVIITKNEDDTYKLEIPYFDTQNQECYLVFPRAKISLDVTVLTN